MARRPKKSEEVNAETSEIPMPPAAETNSSVERESTALDESLLESDSQIIGSQCGGVLSAARQEQGLSVTDVAKQLRLGNKQIEALEEDRFSYLPEPTIVKGFIRNYAKLLKISAEPLLAAYAELMPEKEQYAFKLSPGINMKITGNQKSNTARYIILAIGLLLGVGVWFFYQNYVQKPNPINPIPDMIEALPELALPMSERIEESPEMQLEMPEQVVVEPSQSNDAVTTEAIEQPSEVAVDESGNESSDGVVADVVPSTVAPSPSTVAPTTVAPSTGPAPGKTRIVFNATQETWLSVMNVSGEEVYNKILYAGNRDVIDVYQPSEIVVGNAHGATLVVDGKSIDLAPYTRINVARVRLNR